MTLGANTETPSPEVSLFEDGPSQANGVNSSDTQNAADQNSEDFEFSSLAQDVIQEVTDQSRGGEEPEKKPQDDQANAEDGTGEQGEDDYSDVPFNTHPRFKELVAQKNDFRAQVEELTPKAEQLDNISGFLQENYLSADEAAQGLTIMGLIKTDPIKAWEALRPIAQQVGIAAGEILTPEQQQRVQKGEMSLDQAKMLARAEAKTRTAEAQLTLSRQAQEQRDQNDTVNRLRTAASEWETDAKRADADYAKKADLIRAEVMLMHQQGDRPATAKEVKAQLTKAKAKVEERLGVFRKPKPPVTPITGGSQPPAGSKAPSELSTLDIINGVTSSR